MGKYVIGIDGGGTGSKGITAALDGTVLRTFTGGATNYNGGKKEQIDKNLQALFTEATKTQAISDCQAVCIGSAGVSNRKAVEYLEQAARDMGFVCPVLVVADSETAHAGALNNEEGIVLIAGTGAICLGKKKNKETLRTGGYGHLIDDEGSAYDIARRMLRAVVRAADGRAGQTILRGLVFRQLDIETLEELIAWLYNKERTKKEIAGLAALIPEAEEAGDRAALKILEEAAEELVTLTVPVVEFFDRKASIALSGSVLRHNRTVRENYCRMLRERYPAGFGTKEGLRIQEAEYEADYGAVLLALQCVENGEDHYGKNGN